jgi:hypothetical protein
MQVLALPAATLIVGPFTALWLNRPVVDDGLADDGNSSSIVLFTGLLAVMA